MIDALALAQAMIRCPSVTPADAGAQSVLAAALEGIGFTVHRLTFGEAPDGPVENLFATIGSGQPHFAFAGHTDVVPTGTGWSVDPFAGVVGQGRLVGRGAADMKGSIAAFVAAAERAVTRGFAGTLSLIITGDEEGPATFGTQELIKHMRSVEAIPDLILVGEPTSVSRLGDMMKIGRRGSTNLWLEVAGKEGHVAYPHLADNPITKLVHLLAELKAMPLDDGTDWFQASNLEITDLTVGNPATNVIPARASARLSIRFNDQHSGAELGDRVRAIAEKYDGTVRQVVYGEAFLTQPGAFSQLIADAVEAEVGRRPEASTTGGTSDARFLKDLCPVIEFGLCNATMHKRDEAVAVEDLEALVRIYTRVAKAALAA